MRKSIINLVLSNGAKERSIKQVIEENKAILMDKCGYLNDEHPDLEYGNLLLNSKHLLNIPVNAFSMMIITIILGGDDKKDKFMVSPLTRIDNNEETIVYSNKNSMMI